MILSETLAAAERMAWAGLASLGILFLTMAIRLREDREFALLGNSLILLCLVVAPDIWIPRPRTAADAAGWPVFFQDLQQAAACAFIWTNLRYGQALTGRPGPRVLRAHAAALAGFSVLIYLDALGPAKLLIGTGPEGYSTSWVWDWLYAPYLIATFGWSVASTVAGWRAAAGEARRTLRALSAAYALLFCGGVLDFFSMLAPFALPFPSATVLGALGMGAVGTYLFTAKLLRLYAGQREALLKLAAIHEDMERHRPLGELGRSAAHISESIRGFVAELKADAQDLERNPRFAARSEPARIESARRRLESFTGGILEFSRSARPGAFRPLAPSAVAAESLAALPPGRRERARLSGSAPGPIAGDPDALRRALSAILRNAFEAGAGSVEIRLTEGLGRVCIAVADDGPGVPADRLDRIAAPFYTTRKEHGANGLGAAIAQAVFKTHGGSLSFHPATPQETGLVAVASLPLAAGTGGNGGGAADWILICDEASRIERFCLICSRMGIEPAVRGSSDPGRRAAAGANRFVILDAAADRGGFPADWARFRLPGDADGGTAAAWPWLTEENLIRMAATARPRP